MLQAIIFDMDDTLLDWSKREMSWEDFNRKHLRGIFDYVNAHLLPLEDFEALLNEVQTRSIAAWKHARTDLVAPRFVTVLRDALCALGVDEARLDDATIDACLHAYNWSGMPDVVAFPEVNAVLAALRAGGMRLGLVTNAFQTMWMRDNELRRLGIAPEQFDCRLSAADAGYIKPHPEIFVKALACLGLPASAAIFVGDSPKDDIEGAQRAGMRAVLRQTEREVPPGITPDATIETLHDLFPILEQWSPGWQNGRG